MERLIEDALIASGRQYVTDDDPANSAKLDFYLPDDDLYIEVKRMHSPRIAEQMGRVENVIVAQGEGAVRALAGLLGGKMNGTAK
ncbi:hypothetical protein [Sphingomonas sp. AX6]|uniref:hypothetical protein n=1 Tax=Sphingomonas sp. AX6 TaxID=2653171 RepID=UPI0012F31127|nr:hypothetical protein [Sphingomonas sp. AX6]VXC81598.1 hypothetical protein SPHINGOAX6_50221 [Sphingomonas sp. AX6]